MLLETYLSAKTFVHKENPEAEDRLIICIDNGTSVKNRVISLVSAPLACTALITVAQKSKGSADRMVLNTKLAAGEIIIEY